MRVEEIMTKNPAVCMPDMKLSEVARLMAECDVGQIPVVDSDSRKPIGVVTDRDIIVRAVARGRNPLDLTVRDVMSSPAMTIAPDARIEDACRALEDRQVRRMPVVAKDGSCCGMISQADIAQHAPERMTAEVVRKVSQPMHA
jgi:CBS domain-containing protein